VKVGIIGAGTKVATSLTIGTLKVIRSSSDWLSWGVRITCDGLIGVANLANWDCIPSKLDVDARRKVPPAGPNKGTRPTTQVSGNPARSPAPPTEEEETATRVRQTPLKQPARAAAPTGGPPREEDNGARRTKSPTKTPARASVGGPPSEDDEG